MDSFSYEEAEIYEKIYEIKFYDKGIRDNLGAAAVNTISEWTEKGHTIRKFSRGTLAQTYLNLRKEVTQELKNLVTGYRMKKSTPRDISGIEILQIIRHVPKYNRILDNGY